MAKCKWCGEECQDDFCDEGCMLAYADHPATTPEERLELQHRFDRWLVAQEKELEGAIDGKENH